MKMLGMNMEQVKRQNRHHILKTINANEKISRKDLAEQTGLTPAAVTMICNEFIDQRLIIEGDTVSDNKGAGRRKVLLEINYEEFYVIGITIETEDTIIALTNIKGDVVERFEFKTDTAISPSKYLGVIAKKVEMILLSNPSEAEKVMGGCIALPGIVNKETGVSVHAYGLWDKEVAVCDILKRQTKIPFIIENNVDAFTTAEMLYGIGTTKENLLVLKWGPGVGASIVTDGEIYEGRKSRAGEIGHFIVDPDGVKCTCGRYGCLETKISYQAMNQKVHFERNEFGDVLNQFEDEMDLFARTIVSTMTVLAPDRVVLTGMLFSDERVRKTLIDHCKKYDAKCDEGRIIYSSLADKENYIGACASFVDRCVFF